MKKLQKHYLVDIHFVVTMNQNDNQIICSIDRQKDNRSFDKIPYNRIIYDIILKEKEQKNKINIKPKEKYDLTLNIGMIGCQYTGKTSLSKSYEINRPIENEDDYQTTVSLDYFHRIINIKGKKINISI